MPAANSTIRIDDVDVEYVRFDANADAPTLIFLHEGLGSIGAWRDCPQRLCARTGCPGLAYSRYGNGFSSVLREKRTTAYMHDEALRALPALLDGLSIESSILVGHSDGASIAILYAAARPNGVRGLVLEAPHVFVEASSLASIAAIRSAYDAAFRTRLARYHTDPDATFYGWNDVWLSAEFASWNIESSVEALNAPVLVVQGRDDRYGTIDQVRSIVERHPTTDTLLLAGCGHAPHRERRNIVSATIAGWIGERMR